MSLRRFLTKVLGNANERELGEMQPFVQQINELEREYEGLSDAELANKTAEFRRRLGPDANRPGESLDDLLVEAYAAVREASKRTTGLRHYDVQLLGGVALHRGYALEMKTGEGKTLVATLPLYLNALTAKGAHLITVNDYLARRDVQWMGPIYDRLGLTVGLLQQGQGQAFVFDPANSRTADDYRLLRAVSRRKAYRADITYGTNSEFGFDYLRDNSAYSMQDRVQRGFTYAIVDEVDNILIDEARTPLIISGPATAPTDEYYMLAKVVRQLTPEDFEIDERTRGITLTDTGYDHVEQLLGQPLFDPDYPEEMTPQQAKLLHHLEQALKAQYVMQRDRDYIIQGQRVVIVDEFTGRTMAGRRWSDGLHQAVEAKEGVTVRQENITYATITLQNYFRMYEKLAGMTGTAATEAEEFDQIYKLRVLVLPTNRPIARDDRADVVLRTEEGKYRTIVQDIVTQHCLGRPVLVGTTSVAVSEHLASRLEASQLRKWASATLLRAALNTSQVSGGAYREAMQALNQPLESLSASRLRKLGDPFDVSTNPSDEDNLAELAALLGLPDTSRLGDVIRRGVPHSVLNARHHTEEARIVARAGEVGAVTIATNMAGRGVDIKLGGELDEQTLSHVNRVLRQNDISPYGMSFAEMAQALETIDPERYYLYRDAVATFLKHVADEERVKARGGLHVIGTERHEARRIDNQLRGRAGRQGDPGSSCFYLSLQDDLMRRFGGSRVSDLAARLGNEEDIPIALGIVSRAIANAQRQVEGHNFDIRKHLLDYDDVLNTQREVIYEQRKRILSKPDLRDDVWAMVKDEIGQRVAALTDQGQFADRSQFADQSRYNGTSASDQPPDDVLSAAFRLILYLEGVQPITPLSGGGLFPSFSLQLVLSTLPLDSSPEKMRAALSETIKQALERQQQLVRMDTERTIRRTLESEQASVERLLEAAAIAYEGAEIEFETSGRPLDAASAARAVSAHTGLELNAQALRTGDGVALEGRQLERAIMDQVRALTLAQGRMRMLAHVQARVGGRWTVPAPLLTSDLATQAEEQELVSTLLEAVDSVLIPQTKRLLAEIEPEIENNVRRPADCTLERLTRFLYEVRFGSRTGYDKSHQRVSQRVERFGFTPWAAVQIAAGEASGDGASDGEAPAWDRERLEREILGHLQNALEAWETDWARAEMQRNSANMLGDLDQETQTGLRGVLGKDRFAALQNVRVSELASEDADAVRRHLGERVLFNVQRQLMLDITSRYWVEHLTEMEVLRQGIGLQSYAQKDPLAEYKVRAYDMFQELLRAIQSEVVTAMFTYRPRDLSQVRVGLDRRRQSQGAPSDQAGGSRSQAQKSGRSSKRSRRRRKKR